MAGFMLKGAMGGALLGGAIGAYRGGGQGPKGIGADAAGGAMKGALMGFAGGAAIKYGPRAWMTAKTTANRMLGRSNSPITSTNQALRQTVGSNKQTALGRAAIQQRNKAIMDAARWKMQARSSRINYRRSM